MKQSPLIIFAYATVLLVCGSLEGKPKSVSDEEAPQYWSLEPDLESNRSAFIMLEMSQETILETLGAPDQKKKRKKKNKKNEDPEIEESWVYIREVEGPVTVRSVRIDNYYATVEVPILFIDRVTIGFYHEKVVSVRVQRREENSWEQGISGR